MGKIFFLDQTDQPLYVRLCDEIIRNIQTGQLKPNQKLPSIRQLQKDMHLSKNTIEQAYGQLVSEGYLYSKVGKGYYVMELTSTPITKQQQKTTPQAEQTLFTSSVAYDYFNEYVEIGNFDMGMWKRNINRVLSEYEIDFFEPAGLFGEEYLKQMIMAYFGRVRGLQTDGHEIIIGAGSYGLMDNLAAVLKERGYHCFLAEDPCFVGAKKAFANQDYRLRPIGLREDTLNVETVRRYQRSILFTSPSYQYPYGEKMSINDRLELLNWAEMTDSYIIEDDYNHELSYVGRPIQSLQGLDQNERVIYLGSFSTLLIPSIRISFLILPITLYQAYGEQFGDRVQSSSKLEQLALAKAIDSGDFSRHIRRLRKNYAKKYNAVSRLLQTHLDQQYVLHPAGVSFVVKFEQPVDKNYLIKCLTLHQLKVTLLSDISLQKSDYELGIVLNYRGIEYAKLEPSIIKLKELLCRLY